MRFKSFPVLVLILTISTLGKAQLPAKKFKWKHLGPFEMDPSNVDTGKWTAVGQGWIEDVLIADKKWFAGSITGGLYSSKNEGRKWKKVDTDSVQIGALCLLQIEGTIYRGTGVTHYGERFGFGLYRSTDFGKSWETTGLTFNAKESKVIWDVENSSDGNTLIACTDEEVFLSLDDSRTWESVLFKEKGSFRKILFHKDNPLEVWLAGSELYHSLNGGKTWEDVTPQITQDLKEREKKLSRIDIAQDLVNANRLLVFYGLRNGSCVLESLDGGKSWSQILWDRDIRRADIHLFGFYIITYGECISGYLNARRCFFVQNLRSHSFPVIEPYLLRLLVV